MSENLTLDEIKAMSDEEVVETNQQYVKKIVKRYALTVGAIVAASVVTHLITRNSKNSSEESED